MIAICPAYVLPDYNSCTVRLTCNLRNACQEGAVRGIGSRGEEASEGFWGIQIKPLDSRGYDFGERVADADIAAGRVEFFPDVETAIRALERGI
ncbi:MAG: hypothetical protein ABIE22_00750 [archaeon]